MLSHTTFLKSIFPNSRFILMVRDARATIHSIISRKITISGFNLNSYRDCLERWNMIIETMYNQCQEVGSKSCLIVKYEQLVIHPEENLRKIFEFLNITWNEAVLHHEKFIGDEVSLSKSEKSTDQVIKPVNLDALSNWVGHIPRDVLAEIDTIAPMLKRLGYDTMASVPNYGMPYIETTENAFNVHKNKDYWINLALNNTFYRS
jgi:protein-tyrosine sulfotransferase